jgi:deferrochelatase/peroxidase EfeB
MNKLGTGGLPDIPDDSHVRLASTEVNNGAALLRRGYSYDNGIDPLASTHDQGLLFLAYVRDVEEQFVVIQRRLSAHDHLNPFVTRIGSAVFANPRCVIG